MFTSCPDCARQFRVRAAQLAQAEGLVQCGFCGRQFNALERLYDKPLIIDRELLAKAPAKAPEPEIVIPQVKDEIEAAGPAFIPVAAPPPVVPRDPPAPAFVPDAEADPEELVFRPASTAPDSDDAELDAYEDEDEEDLESEAVTERRYVPPVASKPVVKEYPFADELADAQAPAERSGSSGFWSFAVLLMLVAGSAQAAWFHRDELLTRYPELLPHVKRICQQLECQVIRNRNISAIKLLNRDVRVHPVYENALLVNATITNLSRHAQRFPQILLSLYDTGGKVIAYRQVRPSEYLDGSIDVEAGMAPDAPIHFVLEIADDGSDAVSFEFDFL